MKRTRARRTRHAMENLERLFSSPAFASDDDFESAQLVDELGGLIAAGLTRNGIGTAALLDARAAVGQLSSAANLTREQQAALAAMREALEAWG